MTCGCCDSSTSVAAGRPAARSAPACLPACVSACKRPHVSVWALGLVLLCQQQLNCTQPARPFSFSRLHPPPPPSEPFIQIVLLRIPRQRRSEEEGGREKNPSEERLCTLGVAASLQGAESRRRWGAGAGRRERRGGGRGRGGGGGWSEKVKSPLFLCLAPVARPLPAAPQSLHSPCSARLSSGEKS